MAWGSETSIFTANAVGLSNQAIQWTANQTLNPKEEAHIQVHCNRAGSTDDLNVYVRTSLGTNLDTIPTYSYSHETADDANSYSSFFISSAYSFSVGVRSNGTTDAHVVDIAMRKDGVNAS